MTKEELRDKALSLPYEPDVYLMSDRQGQIIYVGKAKRLKTVSLSIFRIPRPIRPRRG